VNPQSEIGFVQPYNPYLVKKQQKQMMKQAKYAAKYGQYLGMYNNQVPNDDWDEMFEPENVTGNVHPSSKGKDTSERPKDLPEPSFVTEGGHKFALLDWENEEDEEDEEEEVEEEVQESRERRRAPKPMAK